MNRDRTQAYSPKRMQRTKVPLHHSLPLIASMSNASGRGVREVKGARTVRRAIHRIVQGICVRRKTINGARCIRHTCKREGYLAHTTHGPLRINVAFHGELITRSEASLVLPESERVGPCPADSPAYSSTKSF